MAEGLEKTNLVFNQGQKLSKELRVATEIYKCEEKGEKIWFTKLTELLKTELKPKEIMSALRTLFDFGIVKGEYGETSKGRAGRLLFISSEAKEKIRDIYQKFLKK